MEKIEMDKDLKLCNGSFHKYQILPQILPYQILTITILLKRFTL